MPLRIIIVGAGIGGPAAAIDLARNGHDVTIYERSKATSEIGYAFRITPNSDRCLKYLGVDAEAGGACAANVGRMFDMHGKLINLQKENQDKEQSKQATSVFASRPQLNAQLMEVALEKGVKVKTGKKVESVDIERTEIVLEDGTTVSADLIIAADGVHSIVRPLIIDSKEYFPKASTGHNAFRFMVSKDDLLKDKITSEVVKEDSRMIAWVGNNKRILAYPVDFGKQYNITCTHSEELSDKETVDSTDDADIAYNQKVSQKAVLGIYQDFDPIAVRLMEMADPDGLRVWKLMDMEETPTWSKNHTVLLGDAAHPVSPFGFSGASMSIEDAVILSTLLPADIDTSDIPSRLKLYEEVRKPRVGRVRQAARVIGRGEEDLEFVAGYMKFLSSYDAVKEAKDELANCTRKK
jgi:salicylate hydroxylase